MHAALEQGLKMKKYLNLKTIALAACALHALALTALGQGIDLPERKGPRPETSSRVPHVQFGVEVNRELAEELLSRVAQFPGVTLGPTRVSLPGAVGFQFDPGVALANPGSIPGGREFAHLHPDGSLHAALEPELAKRAVAAGWAIHHPWAEQREGWDGLVMLYTPLTETELEVVFDLVEASYTYVAGRPPSI